MASEQRLQRHSEAGSSHMRSSPGSSEAGLVQPVMSPCCPPPKEIHLNIVRPLRLVSTELFQLF